MHEVAADSDHVPAIDRGAAEQEKPVDQLLRVAAEKQQERDDREERNPLDGVGIGHVIEVIDAVT